jgi:hypothetical protein
MQDVPGTEAVDRLAGRNHVYEHRVAYQQTAEGFAIRLLDLSHVDRNPLLAIEP